MTPDEARKILGLKPDDDPTKYFAELADARERIAELVRKAPNDTIALRFQEGLVEFDKALAVIREDLAAKEAHRRSWAVAAAENSPRAAELSKTSEPEEQPPPLPVPAPAPEVEEPEFAASAGAFVEKPGRAWRWMAAFLILAVAAGGGGFLWTKVQEHERLRKTERITFLETLGAKMIEGRQWPEARAAYEEIEELSPGSKIAAIGLRSIEAGMNEEQTQFVGYWSGEALAAFEAGRWDDAILAARTLLEKYPREKETAELLARAEAAKTTQAREDLERAANEALLRRQWDAAEAAARELARNFPGHPAGPALLEEVRAGREKEAHDRMRAQELFAAARVRDRGVFDRDALEWLREALALAPGDAEIAALHEKMASYTRTLKVPGDFDDLRKAVAESRDRDRIVIGEGVWPGPLFVDKEITLEGAGADKTIIEADANESPAATFGPAASGSRIAGLTFRQTSFDPGPNRYPAVLIRGAELNASACRFADASGHGVAAIEGGDLIAVRCVFENNGWDGAAAHGQGSRLELTECEANANFGHGFDVWNGASAAINSCRARDNSGNGILVDTTAQGIVIGENELRGNREFGIVIASGASGRVHDNRCHENLLGGLVVRFAASRLAVENNRAERNRGPGLVLEMGLQPQRYQSNAATGNQSGRNMVTHADFSEGE